MRYCIFILAALAALAAHAVQMASQSWVTNRIYAAIAAIPAPDYSTNNAALVETIQAKAPALDLTPATNYTDAAINSLAEVYIPIYGSEPIITSVLLYLNEEMYEQRMLRFMLPDGWNASAVDFVSSSQITNAGAVAAAAANSAEQLTVATNAALAAAKHYADTAIAAAMGQDASWNRPGEWTLAFDAIPTTPTIHAVEITTNDLTGVVISNATITESQTLSAHVYPVALDEMSPSSPPSVSLSCDEEGTTIDGSVFTATADGVYTVRGTGTNGVTRAASVAIYSSLTRQRTASAYIADTNAVRRDVNEQAAFITANCTYNEILDYPEVVGPGSFKAWQTITPKWAWPGRGRESPWAIAPKVLMTASHYGWYYPTGEMTLRDYIGNTNFTIVVSASEYWPTLWEWAQANGYTAAETAIADMHDLRFGVIEQGYIPDACLPYLVDADELDALFGGSVEGVTAWFYPQGDSLNREDNHYPFCIPVVLGASDYRTERIRWTGPAFFTDRYPALVREDVRAAVGTYDARNWFRIRPGDSGRPCFIMWGAYDIPISQAHTVDTGPSIPAAAKIIRHFCRAHGCEPKSLPANLIPSNQ